MCSISVSPGCVAIQVISYYNRTRNANTSGEINMAVPLRSVTKSVRFTPQEAKALVRRAARMKVRESEYIRSLVMADIFDSKRVKSYEPA